MSCIKVPGLQNDFPPRILEINGDLPDVLSKNKELITSANKVFGKSWSHAVTNTTIDFIDSNMGKYYVGCQATVKVQLSNGIYHEDVGYSSVEASTKGLAVENARLASVTNALMKVLSCFSEMEIEMLQFTSNTYSPSNISRIVKTKFAPKRPVTPPPPAQSTPKIARSPAVLERIQGKKTTNTTPATSNGLNASESNNKMDTNTEDLDIIFENSGELPGPALNVPASSSTTSAILTEEEIRLERKRKQREKQEEYKRQMKEKEEKGRQNLRRDEQRPNPKY